MRGHPSLRGIGRCEHDPVDVARPGQVRSFRERIAARTQEVQVVGESMGRIVGAIERVSVMVGEVSAASGRPADGFEQVNQAVGEMDQSTQQNAALVEQAAAATASLKQQSAGLVRSIDVFKTA